MVSESRQVKKTSHKNISLTVKNCDDNFMKLKKLRKFVKRLKVRLNEDLNRIVQKNCKNF